MLFTANVRTSRPGLTEQIRGILYTSNFVQQQCFQQFVIYSIYSHTLLMHYLSFVMQLQPAQCFFVQFVALPLSTCIYFYTKCIYAVPQQCSAVSTAISAIYSKYSYDPPAVLLLVGIAQVQQHFFVHRRAFPSVSHHTSYRYCFGTNLLRVVAGSTLFSVRGVSVRTCARFKQFDSRFSCPVHTKAVVLL